MQSSPSAALSSVEHSTLPGRFDAEYLQQHGQISRSSRAEAL
eukprot:COSAG02_NODE_3188_length_7205_cov_25.313538_8_plen_42_part_00